MDFIGGLREKTLGEVASTLATEGIGVGAGFIGASTIGRRIEDYMMGAVVIAPTSSLTDKVKGWAYNNVPKVLAWYLLRNYATVAPGEPLTSGKEILVDAKKAIAGSVAFDTILRLVNSGVPVHDPSGYKLLGGQGAEANKTLAPAPSPAPAQANLQADVQKLIQENSALRTELNKALQRLASTPAPAPAPVMQAPVMQAPVPVAQPVRVQAPVPVAQPVRVQAPPVQAPAPAPVQAQAPPVVRYQPVAAPAAPVRAQQPEVPAYYPEIRERKYGFMETPPAVAERERRYGFATNEGEIASMFGMK